MRAGAWSQDGRMDEQTVDRGTDRWNGQWLGIEDETHGQGELSIWTPVEGSQYVGWVEESICRGSPGGKQTCQGLLPAGPV